MSRPSPTQYFHSASFIQIWFLIFSISSYSRSDIRRIRRASIPSSPSIKQNESLLWRFYFLFLSRSRTIRLRRCRWMKYTNSYLKPVSVCVLLERSDAAVYTIRLTNHISLSEEITSTHKSIVSRRIQLELTFRSLRAISLHCQHKIDYFSSFYSYLAAILSEMTKFKPTAWQCDHVAARRFTATTLNALKCWELKSHILTRRLSLDSCRLP